MAGASCLKNACSKRDDMIETGFSFKRPGLLDDADALKENPNGFSGLKCAQWIANAMSLLLPDADIEPDRVKAEDWGWALIVGYNRDQYIIGCSDQISYDDNGNMTPEAASNPDAIEWSAFVSDFGNGGLMPKTRIRRRESRQRLALALRDVLEADEQVTELAEMK